MNPPLLAPAVPRKSARALLWGGRTDSTNGATCCLADFSCAYQSDKLLYHGRMYVSRNYVCFHSQIFKKTIVRCSASLLYVAPSFPRVHVMSLLLLLQKILEFKDIQDVQKKNTAIVFPNALELTAKNRKVFPSTTPALAALPGLADIFRVPPMWCSFCLRPSSTETRPTSCWPTCGKVLLAPPPPPARLL